MTKVTAKITCTWKAPGESTTQLYFGPDYADGANAEWAAATPSLSLMITVRNEVADLYATGGKYTLTFTPEPE